VSLSVRPHSPPLASLKPSFVLYKFGPWLRSKSPRALKDDLMDKKDDQAA
jgi:hypothetical protein